MTTWLRRTQTSFLPFNRERGNGAGNPPDGRQAPDRVRVGGACR